MKISHLFLFLIPVACSYAQQQKDAVLMTLDGEPVYAKEFKQVYRKNLNLVDATSQKDIAGYLELFKDYKLKLAAADALKLGERDDLKQELQAYKDQLATSYMEDSPISEALIKEAYNHMKQEVKASHIMVRLEQNATPQDTARAYQEITSIREKLVSGADFKETAREESDDPSVVQNGGDVGWFSAFKMVYPFEQAAYDTPVGEISPVVRSKYGYHIVKTTDKRDSRGKVEVAHIMLGNDREVNNQERRIHEIYEELQQGASFDLLAQRYSEDSKSAQRGGRLDPFSAGSLSSTVFEEQAFALNDSGQVSEPFQSEVGWHIIKLINKYPVKSLEELRPAIVRQIEQDSRSRLVNDAVQEKMEKELSVWQNDAVIEDLQSSDAGKSVTQKSALLAIKGDTLYTTDFYKYLNENVNNTSGGSESPEPMVAFESFKKEEVTAAYKQHLQDTNEEYRAITREYRDGILLFALMEEKIWNVAKEDTAGLATYFKNNRDAYQTEEKYDVSVLNTNDQAIAQNAQKMLSEGLSVTQVKDSLNSAKAGKIYSTQAVVGSDSSVLPDDFDPETQPKIYNNQNGYNLIVLNEVIPRQSITLDNVRGKVMSDYQDFIEVNWLKDLRERYTLEVNDKVFKKVQKELSR